ncbi:nucleotidyltransferase domain-containing protein [Sporolactobacillus sp. THM7-7]|nr:nucleotidyltransferase domain-containing protein [Sporolactobacillus sp. THM7-7]
MSTEKTQNPVPMSSQHCQRRYHFRKNFGTRCPVFRRRRATYPIRSGRKELMKTPAESAAKKCLEDRFPDCRMAFLGGSSARRELNEYSDIDILIIDDTQPFSYHQCLFCYGWPIELFVFHQDVLSFFFEISRQERIPTLLRLCAEGRVLKDDGSAERMKSQAEKRLKNGPSKWTEGERDRQRFAITDLLNDLNSTTSREETVFIAAKLFDLVPEFVLSAHGQWLGHGKWMFRTLHDFDPSFSEQWLEAYQHLIKTGNSERFAALADRQLARHGGRLFAGYKEIY